MLNEYQTYLKNKDVAGVKFSYVDDRRVYGFLEEVHGLPNNNPITAFGSAQEIVVFLREQWAGMFQRFLQNQERQTEVRIVKDLQANMQTLHQLVTYLTEEKQNSDEAIREILRSNHPIFLQLRRLLIVPHRVFFTTRTELSEWLKVWFFHPVPCNEWHTPTFEEWIKDEQDGSFTLLKISTKVFNEDGGLVIYTGQQWNEKWISLSPYPTTPPGDFEGRVITDDDVPF